MERSVVQNQKIANRAASLRAAGIAIAKNICAFGVLIGLAGLSQSCADMELSPPDGGPSPKAFSDCPSGYVLSQSDMGIKLCKRGADEVVKVGTGGSAFWIDRYEASAWENESGTGAQYGAAMDDYPSTFPDNGQLTKPVFALSKSGVIPSRFLTWFQANEACAASGKRLATNAEWQRAARGTLDPGPSTGNGGACLTEGPAPAGPRKTGEGIKCASDWGVQDMVGNLSEWTGDWMAGVGQLVDNVKQPWPEGYGKDATANISSSTLPLGTVGLPSAVVRDVAWYAGDPAGVFAFGVDSAPVRVVAEFGFRCVVPQ